MMDNDLLYVELKNTLMRSIYEGTYAAGQPIPSERTLSELYGLSRVTVRKTLQLLANQGIIRKKTGLGNIVSFERGSHPGKLDQIALVAPAQRTFFRFSSIISSESPMRRMRLSFLYSSLNASALRTLFSACFCTASTTASSGSITKCLIPFISNVYARLG